MKRDEHIAQIVLHMFTHQMAERIVDLEDEVKSLKERTDFLCALESLGVDNWEGYEEAWDAYNRGDY